MSALIGCGKKGFSISNNPPSSMMSGPSGLCLDERNGELFVADTGNGVIRRVSSRKEAAPIGMPGDLRLVDGDLARARFAGPSTIRMCGGKVMAVDAGVVRAVDLDSGRVSTVYASSRKVVDMACGDGDVFVLEET